MDASVFLGEVEAPIGVEVAVGVQGAELEDGFGAVQAPASAGDVQLVADQMAAGASMTPVAIGTPASAVS